MREHGGEKPIWSTENSITSISFLNTLQGDLSDPGMPYHFRSAAHNVVRLYVTCLSLGIEKAFYYYANRPKQVQWVLDDPANGCLIEPHGSIKPMGVAYATTADLLDGAAFVERIDLAPTVRVYTFQRGDERIAVYWGLFGRPEVLSERPGVRSLQLEIAPGDAADRLEVVDILDNVHPLTSDEWRVTSDEVSDTRHATRDTGVSPYCLPLSQEPVFVRARGMGREDFAALWRNARIIGELPPVEDGTPVPDYKRPIPPQPPFEAASGVPDGRWLFVDLRPSANMGFADERMGDGIGGWSDEGPLNDLRDIPLGRQRFLGVPFEVLNPAENGGKACVVLRSPHTPTLPEAARLIIREGAAVERLYFLHAAAWSSGQQPIGRYVLHFARGRTEEIVLVNGLNNADWWSRPVEGEQSRVVAIPTKVTLNGDPERYLRVLEWINPDPADRLESIDFISSQAGPIPILVAVTGIVP
jgi:hypothetical protein